MDFTARENLREQLEDYVFETLKYIETIKDFCNREPKWTLQREADLEMIRDIKTQADKISLGFDHVKSAEDKFKAFREYMWNGLTQITADSKRQELEKELGKILQATLEGLEKLQHFLDSVEKLAVTSLFVFIGDSFLPSGVKAWVVRSVISAARHACPLLVHFKRDSGAFFLPNLRNVEVMAMQLEKYIQVTQKLCERMKNKSRQVLATKDFDIWKITKPFVEFQLLMSENSMQIMHDHLRNLNKIRMDESFRLTYLFSKNAQNYIGMFSQRRSRMFQFLSDLEETAVQLDRMKMGSNISTVAGSSVGIAGGVLSIVGLALAPVTAGVSLALTLTGVGLGVTSGVNSIVTGITEMAVNSHHGKNANNIFVRFMEDVQKLIDFLEQVADNEGPVAETEIIGMVLGAGKIIARAGAVAKSIDAIVDGAAAVKVLGAEELIMSAANIGLQEVKATRNIPSLAADLPDIGQLAKGTPLALSQSARAGFIAVNALFIGLDVLFICKDSISLSKGSKNEIALVIRSRSVLWRSEVEAWQRIHDLLCKGIWKYTRYMRILEQPFIP